MLCLVAQSCLTLCWAALAEALDQQGRDGGQLSFPSRAGPYFPGGSEGKESVCNAGHPGLIPGEGNGNPFLYSCLENPMDRGAWQVTVHGVTKSQT